jgi:hypothetical protein
MGRFLFAGQAPEQLGQLPGKRRAGHHLVTAGSTR